MIFLESDVSVSEILLEKVKEDLVFLVARTGSSSSAVRLFVDYFPHPDKGTAAKTIK